MKIFIVGINGKMGQAVIACALASGDTVVGGIDITDNPSYPVFREAKDVNVDFDVLIDFSRPSSLGAVIELCEKRSTPAVIATTGYNVTELEKIDALSKKTPVFMTANLSLGVNVMSNAIKTMTAALKNFDIEIIEAHHNQKVDAPSGTAKLLLESVETALSEKQTVVGGRSGDDCKRQPGEIGMHAIRGGTIIGEHTVMFIGDDEIIEIKHTALSRKILANGAVSAAKFIVNQKPGMYNMDDYLKNC